MTKEIKMCSAIIEACLNGDAEEVEHLLEAGADANSVDSTRSRKTALMIAVKRGNIDIVKSLIKGGADVNRVTKRCGMALKTAVLTASPELCQILLESGASPTIKPIERWLVSYFFERGLSDVVKVLLDYGAKGDIVYKSRTPLIAAAMNGHFELVRALIEHGSDVTFERQGERALLATCAGADFSKGDRLAIVKLLLGQNLDVNFIDRKNRTALYEAAVNSKGGEQVVKLLVYHGALFGVENLAWDPEKRCREMYTPLAGAVAHGLFDMVRLLLDLGADVNEMTRKDVNPSATTLGLGGTDISMLMLACRYGEVAVVKELLVRGADVNLRNSAGNTAIHVAVHSDFRTWASKVTGPRTRIHVLPRHQPEILLELLRNGSSVTARNQDGETPLDICMEIILSPNSHIKDDTLACLGYLLKADPKPANREKVLTKLWDTAKSNRTSSELIEETIRILIAAGVRPTAPLVVEVAESHNSLQRKVLAMQNWLNYFCKNATPLRDLCRTRVRASLKFPLNDVQSESWGLPDPLRRFLIMDDLTIFVRGLRKLQLLKS